MADNWEYTCSNGILHRCVVEELEEDDNCKLIHFVHHPELGRMFADISPYSSGGREVVELWIEAGYPNRLWGSWDLPTLRAYIAGKNNWPQNHNCFDGIPTMSKYYANSCSKG